MNMLKILRSSGTLRMLGFDSASTYSMFLTELSCLIGIIYMGFIDISIMFLTELPSQGQNVVRMLNMKINGSPDRDEMLFYQTTVT